MQVNGLPVFYKQRLRGLYPSWAYTAPGTYLRVYYSATEALIWSCIVYWLTGFAPDAGRRALRSQEGYKHGIQDLLLAAFALITHWRGSCTEYHGRTSMLMS